MGQSSGKRRTSIGVLFWIAFILLILVIFLANRSNIEDVLESTGIVEVVRDRFGGEEAEDEPQAPAEEIPESEPRQNSDEPRVVIADEPTPESQDDSEEGSGTGEQEPPADTPERPSPSGTTADEPQADPETRPSAPAQREPSPDPAKPNRLMAGLYYIKVTGDGRTFPQRVVRPVYYASSPLTETLHALITGPSGNELDDGLLNLIPEGTELISAHVDSGTAYLNFNQSFRFNPLGAEGTVAQLLQIIYSSTEFPTVQRVQFLVEGERLDYLGGDGIYVGEPLGRDAFSS